MLTLINIQAGYSREQREYVTEGAKQDSHRFCYLLIALAIVGGAALRFWLIGNQSVEFDEGYTAWLVSHAPAEIIRLVSADTAPPLYYLLLHYWIALFGRSEAALRSLSATASVLTLMLAVDVARRMLKRPAAVAAAAWMLALGFLTIRFAQYARNYALMALFIIASVDCLLCYLESGRRLWLLPAAICFAAALYTHNMALAYAVGLGSLWLLHPTQPSRRRIGDMALTGGLIVLLYLPWVALSLRRQFAMIQHGFWVYWKPGFGIFATTVGRICGIDYFAKNDEWIDHLRIPRGDVEHFAWLATAIVAALALMAGSRMRNAIGQRRMVGLACAALLPPMLVWIYSRVGIPVFDDKLFLPSASLLPICLALPLTRPGRGGWVVVIAATVLITASLFAYEWERCNDDWRGAAAVVNQFPPARRLIVFVANDGQLPFDYYYQGADPQTGAAAGFFDRNPPRAMLRTLSGADLTKLQSQLDGGNYDEVVAVWCHWDWGDPYSLTLPMLEKRFPISQEWKLQDVMVYRLRKSAK